MYELLLISLMFVLSHVYVNIGRIVKHKLPGPHLAVYFGITLLVSIPTVFMFYYERKYNPKGALFCVVVTTVAYLLSRKPIERFVDRLDL